MTTMSETELNTTPLFQTSLRSWQAAWRAEKGQSGDRPAVLTPALHRLGRLKRRVRRPPDVRPRD
jgi:hypothetical protein